MEKTQLITYSLHVWPVIVLKQISDQMILWIVLQQFLSTRWERSMVEKLVGRLHIRHWKI